LIFAITKPKLHHRSFTKANKFRSHFYHLFMLL